MDYDVVIEAFGSVLCGLYEESVGRCNSGIQVLLQNLALKKDTCASDNDDLAYKANGGQSLCELVVGSNSWTIIVCVAAGVVVLGGGIGPFFSPSQRKKAPEVK